MKLFALGILAAFNAMAGLPLKTYQNHPQLVVVIVVDQLRADSLSRPPVSFSDGYKELLEKGAYFPQAEFSGLDNMTCPGHATIATGSWANAHGIVLNEWFDRDKHKIIYCVEDEKDGLSPRRLLTTTVGDELKNNSQKSKIVALALKDRAAILLGGHNSNYSIWWNFKESHWTTSSYYPALPKWALHSTTDIDRKSIAASGGLKLTTDLAINALAGEQLGKTAGQTDMLFISYSSHDMTGHHFGIDSGEMQVLLKAEDREIGRLLHAIKTHLNGMTNVTIALTGDHGIAPAVEKAAQMNYLAGRIDDDKLLAGLNSKLNDTFSNGQILPWIEAALHFQFYFNHTLIAEKKITESDVFKVSIEYLRHQIGVEQVISREDLQSQRLPEEFKAALLNSYRPFEFGDLVLIPKPFFMPFDANLVTHMAPYSYDRTVPLIIYSPSRIRPAVYTNAKVTDLAPTLAFLIGTLPPARSQGRVLSEIFSK